MHEHAFEIFIQRSDAKSIDWQNFVNALFAYGHDFYIEIDFTSEVNFHLYSKQDLSHLATKILPFVLKPEVRNLQKLTGTVKSIFFLTVPQNMSILDVKEREGVKKGRTMTRAVWHLMNYIAVKASTIEIYFEDAQGKTYIAKRAFPDIPYYILQNINWSSAVSTTTVSKLSSMCTGELSTSAATAPVSSPR